MALIRQIKVGGTTYDIGVKAGDGIAIGTSGEVKVHCSSGLRADSSGVSVLISGHDSGYRHGLEYKNDTIALKLASGLKFNDMGYIQLDLGSGLSQDGEGKIIVV